LAEAAYRQIPATAGSKQRIDFSLPVRHGRIEHDHAPWSGNRDIPGEAHIWKMGRRHQHVATNASALQHAYQRGMLSQGFICVGDETLLDIVTRDRAAGHRREMMGRA